MDLGRSEEQFLDWRKGNLTEDSLLFFKPLWQEFPHLDRFPPANAKITGESEATYQESHQMQVDEGSTCSQRQCSLSMMFHGLSLGPETLIQWKASAVARSEENEKWKQTGPSRCELGPCGALWGPGTSYPKMLQVASGEAVNISHILEDQIERSTSLNCHKYHGKVW